MPSQPLDLPLDLSFPTKARSEAWQYFKVSPSHPDVAFCIIDGCPPKRRMVKRKRGNTANLIQHLRIHHRIFLSTEPPTQSIRDVLISQAAAAGVKPCTPQKKAELDQSVVQLIVGNTLAFNVVDSPQFVNCLHKVSGSTYLPPSRSALTATVDDLYTSMVRVLFTDVTANSVSITTDAATLNGGASYMTVTAHYITKDFVLRDVVLAVAQMTESHTGEYVSELLDQVVQQFSLENRVFAAVSDNGANFVRGVRINQHIGEQMRCMIHTLQLSLHDAVSEFDDLRTLCKDVQALVSRIRSSHLLTEELLDIQIERAAEALNLSLSSPPTSSCSSSSASSPSSLSSALSSPLLSLPPPTFSSSPSSSLPHSPSRPVHLLTDAPTRFNSFCLVFTRLLHLKAAVIKLCADNPAQLSSLALRPLQWLLVSEVLEVLRPVKSTCDLLESTLTPSFSFLVPLLCQLINVLQCSAAQGDATDFRRKVATYVATNIYDRVKTVLESETAQVSMMLDPRVRTKVVPQLNKTVAQTALRDTYRRFGEALQELRGVDTAAARPAEPDSKESKEEEMMVLAPPAKKRKCLVDMAEEATVVPASELELYLREDGIGLEECPLEWWKRKQVLYSTLAAMARVYLAIPASSAASERVFSTGKLTLDHKRRSLCPDRVSRLMFLKRNLTLYNTLRAAQATEL